MPKPSCRRLNDRLASKKPRPNKTAAPITAPTAIPAFAPVDSPLEPAALLVCSFDGDVEVVWKSVDVGSVLGDVGVGVLAVAGADFTRRDQSGNWAASIMIR